MSAHSVTDDFPRIAIILMKKNLSNITKHCHMQRDVFVVSSPLMMKFKVYVKSKHTEMLMTL